jgi:uncharacterized membrane protein
MATSTTDGRELPRLHGAVADLGVIVAAYPRYAQAQRAVDYLSDHRFPIEYASIIGSDLSLVAKVMGRMTAARASGVGAVGGAWFGLFIGVMFGLFTDRSWWAVVTSGVAIGAAWGAIFGALSRAGLRGMRDLISRSALAAGSYEILVDPDHADQARAMLSHLPQER